MPVSHVLLVHGYSVRTLGAYGKFPALLEAEGYPTASIFLSAFNSLDDAITCDDLAVALDNHVSQLEAQEKIDVATSAVLCHSTGAIVTRRWILNRLAEGRALPSHFISFAGANHGSTLAQLGETIGAHVFRKLNGDTSVGSGVLTDLDYGSEFLLSLNRDWLEKSTNSDLAKLFAFSMGGDEVGDWLHEIIWQTKEPGSDSTVRISGANLNYSFLDADADGGAIKQLIPKRAVPHLVLHGYSHTGKIGIIDAVESSSDPPFAALIQALHVESAGDYAAIEADWGKRTLQWNEEYPENCNSTVVFSLRDRARRPINDSYIVLGDSSGDPRTLSNSLVNHPIQNEAVHSSVSFYLNHPHFSSTWPHKVHIEARSGSEEIDYRNVDYTATSTGSTLIEPNETTYVCVTINRNTDKTYALYNFGPGLDVATAWPPFPSTGQVPFTPRQS